MDCIQPHLRSFCDSNRTFDVYEGGQLPDDKKSMAFSVVFTPRDEKIKGKKVEEFVEKILADLKDKLNATLRA